MLGSLAKSQTFFYASAFFCLDSFAIPAPARATQTDGLSASFSFVFLLLSFIADCPEPIAL